MAAHAEAARPARKPPNRHFLIRQRSLPRCCPCPRSPRHAIRQRPPSRTGLLIRNLDQNSELALRRRAAVSMEAEARRILADALAEFAEPEAELPVSLGAAMTMLFGKDGGIDLDLPPREMGRPPPDFGDAGET